MIKEALIQFYQSHRKTVLSFSEGVNVFKGSSDSGKSSIIRSLKWCFRNDPLGDDYKSWFMDPKDTTSCEVKFTEGTWVKKERRTKTLYRVSGMKDPLEAVRSDIPDEVLGITHITDNNFQSQHDNYYLLKDTSGEVARKLNRFSGLSIIDKLFKVLKSKQGKSRDRIKVLETNIETNQAEAEKLAYVDALAAEIKILDSFVVNFEKSTAERATLSTAIDSLHRIKTDLTEAEKILPLEPFASELSFLLVKHRTQVERRNRLDSLILTYQSAEITIKEEKEWLEVEKPFRELFSLVEMIGARQTERKQLSDLVFNHTNTGQSIVGYSTDIAKAVKTYEELLAKEPFCPVCKQKVTGDVLKHIGEVLQ